MKQLLSAFLLIFVLGIAASINASTPEPPQPPEALTVTDFYLDKDTVKSGEHFNVHAVVNNIYNKEISEDIYLCFKSAPNGFYGYDDFEVEKFHINLNGRESEEINYTTSIRGEDERFLYYFKDSSGKTISKYEPLQLGECGPEVKRIEIPFINTYVFVDSIQSLLCNVYPGSAPQDVTWEIEDKKLAEIVGNYELGNQGVLFKGLAPGTTVIRATAANGMTASCEFEVYANPVKSEKLTLNIHEFAGNVGDTFQLEATIEPNNVTDPIVYYMSRNDNVATVGMFDGLVEITGVGETEITVWCTPGMADDVCKIIATTSGVENVIDEESDGKADVYGLDGSLILKDADRRQIYLLPKGCYIIQSNGKTRKIIR